jgi:hypothetical protein
MGRLVSGLFGGGPQTQMPNTTTPADLSQIAGGYINATQGVQGLGQLASQANQGGFNNQANVFGQQQQLANQLQAQTQGQGPNPAQAQLAQATGQNVQGQAALMAGQRGAGANAGLIARQAAMQGGAMQQQATGQAATLQAQQQLAAQQQLGQQQQAMQGVAAQQVGQQQTAAQQFAGAGQGMYQNLTNTYLTGQGQMVQNASQANGANSANDLGGKLIGGLAQGVGGGVAKMAGFAQGGEVPRTQMVHRGKNPHGPASHVGHYCNGGLMASGGPVPGQAAKAGNSYSNDTVPAMLSPGEIVIPRSITQGADPAKNAAKFVQAIMARKQRGSK